MPIFSYLSASKTYQSYSKIVQAVIPTAAIVTQTLDKQQLTQVLNIHIIRFFLNWILLIFLIKLGCSHNKENA